LSWVQAGVNLSTPNSGLAGDLVWFKPFAKSAKYYPTGFTNGLAVIGAAYVPPVSGSYQLSLGGAGLASNLTCSVQLGDKAKVTTQSADKLSLNVAASTGLFSGTVVDPGTGKKIGFQGTLLEGGTGLGYFLGTSQGGRVLLGQP
jgi:hypothetical protein